MNCEQCRKRGKNWEGSDPICAFESWYFDAKNWNCASVNLMRDLVYEGQDPMPSGVDYRYCEDQKYATVNVSGVEGVGGALAMWLTWYKDRGRTEGIWLLFSDQPPRPPTEAELMAVIHHYRYNTTVTG